ncbi:hypothetical protein BVX98_05755 [bacterium F11]|nr:hypothetical protein BVX98_05755 [bacterium F11]
MLETTYIILYSLTIIMNIISGSKIKNYLKKVSKLNSQESMNQFKGVVRRDMYLALVQMSLIIPQVILGIFMIIRYKLSGLMVVLLANAIIIGVAIKYGVYGKKMRNLPSESAELENEHQRISKIWKEKTLPDF